MTGMKTDDFIERLARGIEPVTPLHRPWLRATTWLVGAFVYMGALTLLMTSYGDLTANETRWRFLLRQIAAIAVSAAAAAAAFASVIPGASPRGGQRRRSWCGSAASSPGLFKSGRRSEPSAVCHSVNGSALRRLL